MNELLALGNTVGERHLGLSFKQVSRWEQGWARPRPPYTKLLCLLFNVSAQELGLHGPSSLPAHTPTAEATADIDLTIRAAGDGVGTSTTNAWTAEEHAIRREFRKPTVAAAVSPDPMRRTWGDDAEEATELAWLDDVSLVEPGTFDELEAVLTQLDRSYSRECPAELFVLARTYRVRVDQLIQGRHTLKEARELYIYAGWLSEMLAWLAHDLGSPLTAEAYAMDCYRHADQAGHDELCAWAMDAMASIALYDNRPLRSVTAARKGIARASLPHPLAVRLRAQAARAHARLGQRARCEEMLAEAAELYERLPSRAPRRFVVDTGTLASYAVTAYPASASVWLANFGKAKVRAEEALRMHRSVPAESRCPSREAISRIDLAIALAELGCAEEAVGQGRLALDCSRVVDSVLCRAGDLDAVLRARYPGLPDAQEFHERYGEATRHLIRG